LKALIDFGRIIMLGFCIEVGFFNKKLESRGRIDRDMEDRANPLLLDFQKLEPRPGFFEKIIQFWTNFELKNRFFIQTFAKNRYIMQKINYFAITFFENAQK
jgi:hypothetical protein